MKKERKIVIIILVLLFGFLVGRIVFSDIKNNELQKELDYFQEKNSWWEMEKNNCGREDGKDMEIDYCRGFSDGYNYNTELRNFNERMMEEINK